MKIYIFPTLEETSKAAAQMAAELLKRRIKENGKAVFVAATGASQLVFLDCLCHQKGIDWSKTVMFHLDEYIGIDETHPASFRYYLRKNLVEKVHPGEVHWIQGDSINPAGECQRLSEIISKYHIDVAFVGIGENGHLAFNDPPADFETSQPYIVVELDQTCRLQQVKEGWFKSLDDVPRKAITMSIKQILTASAIIAVVPEKRKALAVKKALEGPISPDCPASILRTHQNCHLFLDADSSSLLNIAWLKQQYNIFVANS